MVIDNHLVGGGSLRYAEGVVYLKGNDAFGILHGWVVKADGTAFDPTLKNAEQNRYFGIVHEDTDWYKAHLVKTGIFGVLGGKDTALAAYLTEKGIEPMQRDPRFAELLKAFNDRAKSTP